MFVPLAPAAQTKPRRGPPATLPRQACDGMLGAMVRIAPPKDCEARFFFDSCKRFIAYHKHIISYS
jgi:hypothetical protein